MSCAPKCECDKCKVSKELELSRVEATDEILLRLLMQRKHLRMQVTELQARMTALILEERDLEIDIVAAPGVELPKYQTDGAAGMDLAANEDCTVRAGGKARIPTGLSMAIPKGFVGLVQPRSGLSWDESQLAVTGMIDSDYRGELHVQLFNLGTDMYKVSKGDRIAQFVIMRRPLVKWNPRTELSKTVRGNAGFGSTKGYRTTT